MCLDDYNWGNKLNLYLDSIQSILVQKVYGGELTTPESEKLWRFGWKNLGIDLDSNDKSEDILRYMLKISTTERNYKFRDSIN